VSRIGIYARVSTDAQDNENQLAELRAWCARNGHTVAAEYVDVESGAKAAEKRKRLSAAILDAHKGLYDVLLVYALDRLSREGMTAVVGILGKLTAAGVTFHSYTEPALCSDNEMVRDILLAVMASLAKAERLKISERTRAGLARVRRDGSASGKPIGRPALDDKLLSRIKRLRADNPAMATFAIAKAVGCDFKTVKKYL
jgi:DNA invertase Pin-like site-specific DNA recombinase